MATDEKKETGLPPSKPVVVYEPGHEPVNIEGIDKTVLIKECWKCAPLVHWYYGSKWQAPDQKVLAGFIEEYRGRTIRLDLSQKEVDPWLFNQQVPCLNGAITNVLAGIVSEIRAFPNGAAPPDLICSVCSNFIPMTGPLIRSHDSLLCLPCASTKAGRGKHASIVGIF